MAIVARTHKGQLDAAEEKAVLKFFQNPALFAENQSNDAVALEDYMFRWGIVIDDESLSVALQKLVEAGVIKLKSDSQVRWEQGSKHLSRQVLDALESGMRQCRLVVDGDEGFENKANLLGYLQGREVTTANILRGAEYLSGGKGVKVYWVERPSQTRDHRAHIPTSPDDHRWAPKEDSNRHPLSRHSHSSDPRFNGENDRAKMKRLNSPTPSTNRPHLWIDTG